MTVNYLAGAFTAALYPILTTCMYYLGSRALLTEAIWSRYPKWLDALTLCAACSGFWYGMIVAFGLGWYLDVPFLMLPGRLWCTPIVVGLFSIVTTPILAERHIRALSETSPPMDKDDAPKSE